MKVVLPKKLNQIITSRFFDGFEFVVYLEFGVDIFDVFSNG